MLAVDWFRLLTMLEDNGISAAEAGRRISISRFTVWHWKNGSEPLHSKGEALIALFRSEFPNTDVPRIQQDV